MIQERFHPDINSPEETNEIIRSQSETTTGGIEKNVHFSQLEIPKLETELFALNTDKEGLANYIEKIRRADPSEKFPVFHGTRGGYSEIPSILQSEEKGVRGGKVGRTPTYALYPVAAYWIQADSAGLRYMFERRQIQLPEESATLDTVVKIDELGSAFITKDLDHLSLIDFEGEVLFGPRVQAPPEIAKNIQQELSHIRKMSDEIKPIMHTMNEQVKAVLDSSMKNEFLENRPGVRQLEEKLFPILPLTYKQYQTKIYEQKLAVAMQCVTQRFEEIQRIIKQQQESLEQFRKDGDALSATLKKVRSRNNLLWLSKVLTRRFIEKQAPPIIQERLLDTLRGKERGTALAEKVRERLLSYGSLNESQFHFIHREIEEYHQEREYCIHIVEAVAKIKEILQSYESIFAQKIYPFLSDKVVE